ncbi:hypothetical protein ACJZ2D_001128 [Fusarium nematophilum]
MGETLQSLLCRNIWHYDSEDKYQISFSEDGKGELICSGGNHIWLAAEIEWKSHGTDLGRRSMDRSRNRAGYVAQFLIQITITRRRLTYAGGIKTSSRIFPEGQLTVDAHFPKVYSVALEQGNFLSPLDAKTETRNEQSPTYRYRLTFDPSPYPPRLEWTERDGAIDALKVWEWRTFCGQRIK